MRLRDDFLVLIYRCIIVQIESLKLSNKIKKLRHLPGLDVKVVRVSSVLVIVNKGSVYNR